MACVRDVLFRGLMLAVPQANSSHHNIYRRFTHTHFNNMPSSKGKPTDPELREQIKEGNCAVLFADQFFVS